MTDIDIDATRQTWLNQCGPCDAGLPMPCSHPQEDYRPVMSALLAKVDELTAKIEDRRARLVEAEADLLNVRGILSPNGFLQRVPVDLVPTVAPAVRWLADRVDELTAALAERDAKLTAANRRADGLEADLRSANTANTAWANQTARVTDEPGPEVTKVYDRDGDTWIRSPQGWRYRTPRGDGDPWAWDQAAGAYGPMVARVEAEATR